MSKLKTPEVSDEIARHMCKQIIWESALRSGFDIQIIMNDDGEIKLMSISSLMQYAWPDEDGRR